MSTSLQILPYGHLCTQWLAILSHPCWPLTSSQYFSCFHLTSTERFLLPYWDLCSFHNEMSKWRWPQTVESLCLVVLQIRSQKSRCEQRLALSQACSGSVLWSFQHLMSFLAPLPLLTPGFLTPVSLCHLMLPSSLIPIWVPLFLVGGQIQFIRLQIDSTPA